MKFIGLISIIFLTILLTGCPETPGLELDTSIYLKNNQSDTLKFLAVVDVLYKPNDTIPAQADIDHFFRNLNNPLFVLPQDSIVLFRKNWEKLSKASYASTVVFLVNADSIRNMTPEEVKQRGVIKYLLYGIQDYEAVNYTLSYPKQ